MWITEIFRKKKLKTWINSVRTFSVFLSANRLVLNSHLHLNFLRENLETYKISIEKEVFPLWWKSLNHTYWYPEYFCGMFIYVARNFVLLKKRIAFPIVYNMHNYRMRIPYLIKMKNKNNLYIILIFPIKRLSI